MRRFSTAAALLPAQAAALIGLALPSPSSAQPAALQGMALQDHRLQTVSASRQLIAWQPGREPQPPAA